MKLKLYRWKAQDRLNQPQKGMIVAENETYARQQLQTCQLQKIRLQQNWQLSYKPKNAEICDLLSQLAILLQSSVPLKNSLHILLQNCANIQLNQWLRHCISDIERGLSFSQTLENQGLFLTMQERQLIRVGEMTGKLATVCTQIAAHKQQSLALQRKIQKILLYPVTVLGISVMLTSLLLIFIVPQFAEMYGENQAALPTFTVILLSLSAGLSQYFWHIMIFSCASIALIKHQLQYSLRLNQFKIKLFARLPIISTISALSRLIHFCQSLQLMLQSGVPLNQALQSFLPQKQRYQKKPKIPSDPQLIAEIEYMINGITQGHPFSATVSSSLFPMQAQQMLQVGESTGKLGQMLQHIADTYKKQLDHQVDLLSQLIEPLLMLIIGSLIGLIMLGMYMPIFNMGSLIQ